MDILDYTNYDNVRALLGVNSTELKDDTLALEVYSSGMMMALEDLDFGVPTKYVEIDGIAEADRTAEQKRFYLTARSFAAYAVAKQLATSLPLFSPKEVSDSKTLVSRFSANPYADTIKEVAKQFDALRLRLLAAYNAVLTVGASTSTARVFIVSSGTIPDPVTGS